MEEGDESKNRITNVDVEMCRHWIEEVEERNGLCLKWRTTYNMWW